MAGCIDREYRRHRVETGVFRDEHCSGAQRVLIGEFVAAIKLESGGEEAAIHLGRHAVEIEVSTSIGPEANAAAANEARGLQSEPICRLLICQHGVGVVLGLVFIQSRRIDHHASERKRCAGGVSPCGLAGDFGDLKVRSGTGNDPAQATGFVEDIGKVAEAAVLIGHVVQRVRRARWILQAESGVGVATRHVVVQIPTRSAVFDARSIAVVRAAVQAHFATVEVGAAAGVDVDHAGGAKSKLRRERAGDHLQLIDKTGVEFLAESSQALREQDVVDAILKIRVLAAQVHLAIRVLGYARGSQQHLIERAVRSLDLVVKPRR